MYQIVWRAHLDLYTCKAEPLPVIKITPRRVYVALYSGAAILNDGTVQNIGTRTVIALDRAELESGAYVRRGRIIYGLHNPDDDDEGTV